MTIINSNSSSLSFFLPSPFPLSPPEEAPIETKKRQREDEDDNLSIKKRKVDVSENTQTKTVNVGNSVLRKGCTPAITHDIIYKKIDQVDNKSLSMTDFLNFLRNLHCTPADYCHILQVFHKQNMHSRMQELLSGSNYENKMLLSNPEIFREMIQIFSFMIQDKHFNNDKVQDLILKILSITYDNLNPYPIENREACPTMPLQEVANFRELQVLIKSLTNLGMFQLIGEIYAIRGDLDIDESGGRSALHYPDLFAIALPSLMTLLEDDRFELVKNLLFQSTTIDFYCPVHNPAIFETAMPLIEKFYEKNKFESIINLLFELDYMDNKPFDAFWGLNNKLLFKMIDNQDFKLIRKLFCLCDDMGNTVSDMYLLDEGLPVLEKLLEIGMVKFLHDIFLVRRHQSLAKKFIGNLIPDNEGFDELSKNEQKLVLNFIDKFWEARSNLSSTQEIPTEIAQKKVSIKKSLPTLYAQIETQNFEAIEARLSAQDTESRTLFHNESRAKKIVPLLKKLIECKQEKMVGRLLAIQDVDGFNPLHNTQLFKIYRSVLAELIPKYPEIVFQLLSCRSNKGVTPIYKLPQLHYMALLVKEGHVSINQMMTLFSAKDTYNDSFYNFCNSRLILNDDDSDDDDDDFNDNILLNNETTNSHVAGKKYAHEIVQDLYKTYKMYLESYDNHKFEGDQEFNSTKRKLVKNELDRLKNEICDQLVVLPRELRGY